MKPFVIAAAAAALLAACEARVGNDAGSGDPSAAGKAEEGQLTVDTPGFEMKIDIPHGLRGEANFDEESGLVYPGSSFSGIHVAGGSEGSDGRSQGEVELRFTSPDAPDRVAAWYRDPARASDFAVASAAREGDAIVISGTGRRDNEQFRVRLAPRAGGGTDGRLLLRDAS